MGCMKKLRIRKHIAGNLTKLDQDKCAKNIVVKYITKNQQGPDLP